jgi:DNA repair protein RadC
MKLRINETQEPMYNFRFKTAKDVYDKMKEYAKADREMFHVMYLNAQNQVMACELHTIGSVGQASIYTGEVFRGALLANAARIICVHNHPGGQVTPSAGDDEITKEIVKAGLLLQVKLLDHVIIAATGFYSYADNGRIQEYELEAGIFSIFK